MADLIAERLKKNRELKVTVGKFTFLARRPTDEEAIPIYRRFGEEGALYLEVCAGIARDCVFGWQDVIEDDVIGGGGDAALTFSAESWKAWCSDRKDFWQPIAEAVLAAYRAHSEKVDAKN